MLGAATSHIGPYEIRGELGRGAMAHVWRGWDPNLEREVAIKEPAFDSRLSENVLAELGNRFVAEGRTAARLNHPGIVSIYAADVWNGRPAIVMELVEGQTLGERLSRGPLSPQEALSVLDQLLDAVGYAHAHGVIHRDIKPENIFITYAGQVKLADFGIARIDDSASHATIAGTVLGTPGYMSPEQAVGRPVDARSDLFSVGVVAYEMLMGRNPFGAGEGTDATTLIYRIVHEPAPDLPPSATAGLPADLRPAIMSALAKNPDDRPATAEAFKAMLHGGAPQAVPPVMTQPTPVTARRATSASGSMPSWLPYVLVFAVGMIALAIVFISATSGGRGGGSAPAPQTQGESTVPTEQEQQGEPAEAGDSQDPASTSEPSLYLGVHEGEMALFEEGAPDPVETMGVSLSDLTPEDAAALGAHVAVSSYDDAYLKVEEFRTHAEEAERAERIQQAAYPPSFGEASASSELPGDSITSYYGALNVLDSDFKHAWNEGAGGDGIGEWVMVSATEPQRVRGIDLVNGYPKSEDIYYKNNRCKDVRIELSDGHSTKLTLADDYAAYQHLDFGDDHATTYVKIYIESVYEGSKWEDTSICIIRAF